MPPGRENLSRATGLLYLNFNPNPELPAMGGFRQGSPSSRAVAQTPHRLPLCEAASRLREPAV